MGTHAFSLPRPILCVYETHRTRLGPATAASSLAVIAIGSCCCLWASERKREIERDSKKREIVKHELFFNLNAQNALKYKKKPLAFTTPSGDTYPSHHHCICSFALFRMQRPQEERVAMLGKMQRTACIKSASIFSAYVFKLLHISAVIFFFSIGSIYQAAKLF